MLNDYLLLLGIYNSFPTPWKNILKSSYSTLTWQSFDPKDLDHNIYIDGENVKLEQLTTKKLYWTLVTNIQVPPSAQQKFNNLFKGHALDWKKIYMVPHKATIDTKTRSFQYKLLNRIVYTNKSLFKMKLVDSPMCTFCNLLEESLEHLFCNCNCSKDFGCLLFLG